MKQRFRFIPMQTFSASMNMAYDEAIMEAIVAGESMPTIRFYKWAPSAVSIGYFQGLKQEIAEDECEKQGVDIVRRQTGGGAVYHEHEITYSIIGFAEDFPKNIIESYAYVCGIVVDALKRIGLTAVFSPINDVLVDNQKISGNAQTRKKGLLLQHGTILVQVDVDKMFSLLKVGKEKMSDKLVASVKKVVTSLELHGKSEEEFLIAFRESFAALFELIEGDYSQKETQRAKELADEKYGSLTWIGMR